MVRTMSSAEFARVFTTRGPRVAWFLGAGASASAGVPTGYDMILDFKTRLYADATNLTRRELDTSDPLWRERINEFFNNQHGFPSTDDPSEYSVAFAAVYPNLTDRRAYIEEQVRRGTGSYGHRVLASLISTKKVPAVVTTNFDPFIERATVVTDELLPASERAHVTISAIDSAERGERVLADGAWPLLVKLHGDYQEVALKNTADELRKQDDRQRRTLIGLCQRLGLLAVGYSGRDDSVMEALEEAVGAGAFPGGVYWARKPGQPLLDSVTRFLERAEAAGIDTALVDVSTFDELAGELARGADLPAPLVEHIDARAERPAAIPVKLPTAEAAQFPVLRCSALPILKMPDTARMLTLQKSCTLEEFRQRLGQHNVRKHTAFAMHGTKVTAFGRDADFLGAAADLGIRVDGQVPLDPLTDSWAVGLLVDALAGSLVRGRPLRRRHVRGLHAVLAATPRSGGEENDFSRRTRDQFGALQAAYGGNLTGNLPKLGMAYAEGVYLRLEHRANHWWCVYEPFTWVDTPKDPSPEVERAAADWRRERWAGRYNKTWANIIDAWATLFTAGAQTPVRSTKLTDDVGGVAAEFVLSPTTGWARPAGVLADHSGGRS
jgi:NAD-dependent SIR2 family protein deacetylase